MSLRQAFIPMKRVKVISRFFIPKYCYRIWRIYCIRIVAHLVKHISTAQTNILQRPPDNGRIPEGVVQVHVEHRIGSVGSIRSIRSVGSSRSVGTSVEHSIPRFSRQRVQPVGELIVEYVWLLVEFVQLRRSMWEDVIYEMETTWRVLLRIVMTIHERRHFDWTIHRCTLLETAASLYAHDDFGIPKVNLAAIRPSKRR